jgi:hypothetical protein
MAHFRKSPFGSARQASLCARHAGAASLTELMPAYKKNETKIRQLHEKQWVNHFFCVARDPNFCLQ